MSKNYDVVVIGGGPGGYVAAIRASQLGLKTAIVERENLGGICLNWGCIPTKALLKASELYASIEKAAEFGIKTNGATVDVKKLIERSRDVAGGLSQGVEFLMKKNNVDVFMGQASFAGPKALAVQLNEGGEESLLFKNAIVATGARPREIKGVLETNGENVWHYRHAMTPEKLPKSLLVIGSGAIGMEFASFYNTLGTQVQVVEAQENILPVEDKEVSKLAEKMFKKKGVEISTSAKVLSLKPNKKDVEVELEVKGKTQKQKYEKVLLAIGVQGNIEGLGLEGLGLRHEHGLIEVDEFYQTSVDGIYAIGDIIGRQQLAHVASHEGVICAEHIAGQKPHAMNYENIPGCTYCTPQVGSVGLTEQTANDRGLNVKVGRFNYSANGKALAAGEGEGFVKTIFDQETGELLGAHIIGADATEMITTFVLGKSMECTEEDITHACLPHPTLSEMIAEATLDSDGRALNA
ncbi:MAG: dihydrolipoyl dehydrogenase [Magnetococcales bacterium]|nr:dihydrolipoyl dehydrogenase [Magnetococcales bacterium]|tara:strand:+ start:10993 stop:12390 length:1398 start_codon:yes stop_codon:yes gene_type:complete